MALIYAGIDEAGYGPLLGPLCVGMVALRIGGWEEGEKAPDVWKLLSRAVCREARDSKRRIAIDDSKNLKLANSSVNKHPLYHLERGVAGFLACMKKAAAAGEDCGHALPGNDLELFDGLGVKVPEAPWYGGEAGSFPVGSTAGELRILANALDLALGEADVGVLQLTCEAMEETVFNQIVESAGTKAAATEAAIVKHFWTLWDAYGAIGAEAGSALRVVCDRQGGRTDYTQMLGRAFPGCKVQETHASSTQSRYEIEGAGERGEARKMGILFMTESESAHMPVALASMAAKLTRELMMARFNRYWCARMPELKPTAGYRGDGQRWLTEAKMVISDGERAAMIRRA